MKFTPNKAEKTAAEMGFKISHDGKELTNNGVRIFPYIKDGYYQYSFGPKIKRQNLRLHRLQAWQKYGEAMHAAGIVCRHLDGNALNNHHDNIAIGTQSENIMDQSLEIRKSRAQNAANSLKKHDWQEVRKFYDEHGWKTTLAHFEFTSKGSLSYILNKTGIAQ